MPGGILLNPSAAGSGDCCCGGGTPPSACAACFPSPTTLTITDSNATFTAPVIGGLSWRGSYTLSKTGVNSFTLFIGGGGATYTTGSITIRVTYTVTCNDGVAGGPVQLVVQRSWRLCNTDSTFAGQCDCGHPTDTYRYVDDSIASVGGCGSTDPFPSNCGVGSTATFRQAAPTQCGPLVWSGTPPTGTLDPAPGAVLVTT